MNRKRDVIQKSYTFYRLFLICLKKNVNFWDSCRLICERKVWPIFIILKKRNISLAINMIYYILLKYNSLYYPQFNRFKDDDLLKLLIIREVSSKKIVSLGFSTRKITSCEKRMWMYQIKHIMNRKFGWQLSPTKKRRQRNSGLIFLSPVLFRLLVHVHVLSRSSNYFSGFVIGFYN